MGFHKALKEIETGFNAPMMRGRHIRIVGFNSAAKTKDGRTVEAYRVQYFVGETDYGRPLWSKPEWIIASAIKEQEETQC